MSNSEGAVPPQVSPLKPENSRFLSGLSLRIVSRLGLLFLIVGSLLFFAAHAVMKKQFDDFDERYYAAAARQVALLIEADNESLLAATTDYSVWDLTYDYVETLNPEYLAENFATDMFGYIPIDGVDIENSAGKSVVSFALGPSDTLQPVDAEVLNEIRLKNRAPLSSEGSIEMFYLSGRPVALARFPITNTAATLPPKGTMVFFRWLDGAYQERLQKLCGVQFELHKRMPSSDELVAARANGTTLLAYRLGSSPLYVYVAGKTTLSSQRAYATSLLLGTCIALMLLSLVGTFFVLRQAVLRRLALFASISDRTQGSAADDVEAAPWPVAGRDELDQLALSHNKLHSELHASRSAMKNLAFSDPLTELPNRRLMLEQLRKACVASQRSGGYSALLLFDLNNFKSLNDAFGHRAGDELLVHVAGRLKVALGESDKVARFGGDEFTALLEGLSPDRAIATRDVEEILRKLSAVLSEPFELSVGSHTCSASIGVTLFNSTSDDVMELTRQADLAMYKAKRAGGQSWQFFDTEQQRAAEERHELEQELARALALEQLFLVYQVKRDARGFSTGAEVLLRWRHPTLGLVSPSHFISAAESTGLIVPIGTWVLRKACEKLAVWAQQAEFAHLGLSVNMSAVQFHQADFVQQVKSVIAQTGAPAHRLRLELTESLLVRNAEAVIKKMEALAQCGVTFSLDDFGTGYSSLAYLKRLPLDELKIDRSFVRDLLADDNEVPIVKMILALAESMHLEVVAEGVETAEQHAILLRYGCPGYQGFLYGWPVPIHEFEAALKTAA
jgi:diguanylate cyclase (GGDEF)-like protein